MNALSGIYCIENIINHKKYIGYSKNIQRRWNYHKSLLKNDGHENKFLQRAWNKYGEHNFVFYIIELCPTQELIESEQFYIKYFCSMNDNFGYNLNLGGIGNLGWIPTEENIRNKSVAVTGDKNPMFGIKHKEETKKMFSQQRINNKNGVGNKNSLCKKRKNSSSQYYGVCSNKKSKNKPWSAFFINNCKTKNLGMFEREIDAAMAWDAMSWNTFHDITKLNFPENIGNNNV